MLNVEMKGFDKLQRQLKEADRALASLDGTITTVKVTPGDPSSLAAAIRQMESAVDTKMQPYRSNPIIAPLIEAAKKAFREKIKSMKA